MGHKVQKGKTRKKSGKSIKGAEIALGIRDLRLIMDDFECYTGVDDFGEVVVALELPEEPTKDDLAEAEKLRDRVDDLIDDLKNELGVADSEESEDDDLEPGEDEEDDEDELEEDED